MMRAISQGNLHQFTFNGFEKESYISVKVTLIGAGTKPDQEIADSTYWSSLPQQEVHEHYGWAN